MDKHCVIPKDETATDNAGLRARHDDSKIKSTEEYNSPRFNYIQEVSSCTPKRKSLLRWYESNPILLEAEKAAMVKCFPNFKLGKLDDGRLYWEGELAPGVYETKFGRKKSYYVMAVYQNNHPNQQMGSSVYVYLVNPDVDELEKELRRGVPHVLKDSADEIYICTCEADNIQTGSTVTTAASVLLWAVKWLLAYELVLTGDLDYKQFNTNGVI